MSVSGKLAQDMVSDWLYTPVNGYLGSDYGQDIKRALHTPLSARMVDNQVAKLRTDVPVLNVLPPGAVNIYSRNDGIQRVKLFIDVAGHLLPVDNELRRQVATQPAQATTATASAQPPATTQGLPRQTFPSALGDKPVAVTGPATGDLLQYQGESWTNVNQSHVADGGDF